MERVERIRKHPLFLGYLMAIEQAEQDRIFCCHGLEHALDVARIMYIIALENQLKFPKDVIYGTALLHDIGRKQQYENGKAHHETGAVAAGQILTECGYGKEEVQVMTEAIRFHQVEDETKALTLKQLLYTADKKSRACYHCSAEGLCYWESERKNNRSVY